MKPHLPIFFAAALTCIPGKVEEPPLAPQEAVQQEMVCDGLRLDMYAPGAEIMPSVVYLGQEEGAAKIKYHNQEFLQEQGTQLSIPSREASRLEVHVYDLHANGEAVLGTGTCKVKK